MTPKEKATELSNKYFEQFLAFGEYLCIQKANLCALILVNEMINEVYNISHQHTAKYDEETKFYNYAESKELKFWNEVKNELEKL